MKRRALFCFKVARLEKTPTCWLPLCSSSSSSSPHIRKKWPPAPAARVSSRLLNESGALPAAFPSANELSGLFGVSSHIVFVVCSFFSRAALSVVVKNRLSESDLCSPRFFFLALYVKSV